MSIRFAQHEVQTTSENKIALNCFDSKRILLNDNFATLPCKYYLTPEDAFMNQILLEDEWEGSGDIIPQSSGSVLPDVDIMPEDNFLVPDQGYRQ